MSNTDRFHAIASALLDRRIRNMRRLDEKIWIDTSLITHAEYQLFLIDMNAQGKYHQPDHWEAKRFPPGKAQSPVVGVRPSAAEAFCRWLTKRGRGMFRLPYQDEKTGIEDTWPGFWQMNNKEQRENNYSYKGKIRALNLDREHALARVLDRDLEHALNLDLEHALALALDRDLTARTLAARITRTTLPTLDRDLDLARELVARALALSLARDRHRDHDFTLDRDLAFDLARAFGDNNDLRKNKEYLQIVSNLLILSLRRQGLLPAFEGILIVREED